MNENANKPDGARVLVIVPSHNEAGSIAAALKDLRVNAPWADVVVIDDGSTDETAAIAAAAGCEVVKLPCNLGVGGAVQTGYICAFEGGYDVAVQFDGDAQHRANQIPALIRQVLDGDVDLVIGSRMTSRLGFRFRALRFIGSRLLAALVSTIVGRKITDPTSGFRAASRKAVAFFARNYPQAYLADTSEALVWAARRKLRIAEVPTRMRVRSAGVSAVGNVKGLAAMLRITLAILVDCIEPSMK